MYVFSGIVSNNKENRDILFNFANINIDNLHEFGIKIIQNVILFNGETDLTYNRLKKIIKIIPSNNILITGDGKYSFININHKP